MKFIITEDEKNRIRGLYEMVGDKYYYSLKGQNNWVEANGKVLESIKNKVTFS